MVSFNIMVPVTRRPTKSNLLQVCQLPLSASLLTYGDLLGGICCVTLFLEKYGGGGNLLTLDLEPTTYQSTNRTKAWLSEPMSFTWVRYRNMYQGLLTRVWLRSVASPESTLAFVTADTGNLELTTQLTNTCSKKQKLSLQHIPGCLSIFSAALLLWECLSVIAAHMLRGAKWILSVWVPPEAFEWFTSWTKAAFL